MNVHARAKSSDSQPADRQPVQTPSRGSSFYLGMRILPREQRQAMYAIYGFCRAVDDVADGTAPVQNRLEELETWRTTIDRLYASDPLPAGLEALQDAIRRFGLDRSDFDAVIDGMASDARTDVRMADWSELDLYCDRVASAPGRLSVRVFGLSADLGLRLANHLGRALQLTNILRDVDEDAAMGRLYLPREALTEAGITSQRIGDIVDDSRLTQVGAAVACRARLHFEEADRVMGAAPRESVRAPRLMAAAYRPLLERLEDRGWAPPRRKVARKKRVLAGAVLRYGLF